MRQLVQHLLDFGLTQLEAEVYLDLLQNEPSTGYAVGKRIGRQTANVYKAVDSLATRGAVLIEDGERNRLCRAVPASEFLTLLERQFQTQKAETLRQLDALTTANDHDDRIYLLNSVPLVLERARMMLGRCRSICVIDAFPEVLAVISAEIVAAAQRGVTVFVQAYKPIELSGAQVTLTHLHEANLDIWATQQLNLIVDAEECLLALMNNGLTQVHQAHWSHSTYLAFLMHVGLLREHNIHQLLALPQTNDSYEKMQSIIALDERFHPEFVPGLARLFQRFGKQSHTEKPNETSD